MLIFFQLIEPVKHRFWEKSTIFNEENVKVHTCVVALDRSNQLSYDLYPHLTFSLYLAVGNYFMFPNLEKRFCKKRFVTMLNWSLKQMPILRTSTNHINWNGSRNWKNIWQSEWSSKETTLRNKIFFSGKIYVSCNTLRNYLPPYLPIACNASFLA